MVVYTFKSSTQGLEFASQYSSSFHLPLRHWPATTRSGGQEPCISFHQHLYPKMFQTHTLPSEDDDGHGVAFSTKAQYKRDLRRSENLRPGLVLVPNKSRVLMDKCAW